MTQSRNVREGRYYGWIGGKHFRSRGMCLQDRQSMFTLISTSLAIRDRFIAYVGPDEIPIQEQLKGQGPFPKDEMEAELGQFGTVRFVRGTP